MATSEIFINLEDQLGNQLFAYASAKCIARRLGFGFRFRVADAGLINSVDSKRGRSILALLPSPSLECAAEIPAGIDIWIEPQNRKQNFRPELLSLSRSTLLKGHLQSYSYLEGQEDFVRSMFVLDAELVEFARSQVEKLKFDLGVKHLFAVHYRCGPDYKRGGWTIGGSYYRQAIALVQRKCNSIGFVMISDAPEEAERNISLGGQLTTSNGTLFEDLALMTMCDGHIIGNSTFAWWGAFLSGVQSASIIRPSVYPTGYGYYCPTDIFPTDWEVVDASRALLQPKIIPRYIAGYLWHRVRVRLS